VKTEKGRDRKQPVQRRCGSVGKKKLVTQLQETLEKKEKTSYPFYEKRKAFAGRKERNITTIRATKGKEGMKKSI